MGHFENVKTLHSFRDACWCCSYLDDISTIRRVLVVLRLEVASLYILNL